MIRKLTIATTFSLLLGLTPALSAAPRPFFRPGFGYYGYWGPSPLYGSRVILVPPATGELKIKTNDKDARVYVDGGYLGIARKLKRFDMRPGNHEVELRDARGNVLFSEKVAIMPGETTEFNAMGIAE